jgi:hypothetical protein
VKANKTKIKDERFSFSSSSSSFEDTKDETGNEQYFGTGNEDNDVTNRTGRNQTSQTRKVKNSQTTKELNYDFGHELNCETREQCYKTFYSHNFRFFCNKLECLSLASLYSLV